MNKMLNKIAVAALAMLAVPLMVAQPTFAWGPERTTYTMANPATKAVFNSITDNAAIGDERDFVRIAEVGTEDTFSSELILDPGKEYVVMIYYHNDASATYNDAAHNRVGFAENVRMMSFFPGKLAKGERGKIDGVISASNTDPLKVWDEAYITAREAIKITYVPDTAVIRNQKKANGTLLSTDLFTSTGVLLGSNTLSGLVPGCDEYAGEVFYRLKTEAIEVAAPPVETQPVQEMPNTGPAEIALATVVIVAVVAGVVYWRRSHRAVKKATKAAKGKSAKSTKNAKSSKSGARKKPAKRK